MRFVYNDPHALRNAVEQLATGQQPIGTRRERDLPIPVDVYQLDSSRIVMEAPDVVDAVKGKG